MKREESSSVKVRRKRTSSLVGGTKRSNVPAAESTPGNSAVKVESVQIKSEDVLPVKIGEELDKILADERSPPTIEDQMRTIFRSAILDHLIVGWETEPCMRNIYGKPPPAVEVPSADPSSLVMSSIMSFTSEARQSQQEMHAKKRKKSRKSIAESATSITQRQGSSEKKQKSGKFSSGVKESQPAVGEEGQEKTDEISMKMEGTPSKQSTRSKENVHVIPSKEGDSSHLPVGTSSKDFVSLSKEKIESSESSLPVKQWEPPHFPDENVNVTFVNGNQYVGRVSRKLMEGEGHYIWNDGRSYKGDVMGGKMTGQGHFEWADLNTYCGQMNCGWRHGKGSFVFYDVNVAYEGDWFWGLKHGEGISLYNWDLNDWYWGGWKNDLYDGFGKRHYPNGAYYIGEWRLGRRHGTGSQIWPNSDLYRGGWRFGAINGYGEYIWSLCLKRGFSLNPGTHFRGTFLNGMRHGPGELHVGNGASINAQWVNDLKQGPATVVAGNGKVICEDPLFLDDRALPKDKPHLEERKSSGMLNHDSTDVVKIPRKGTKPFCRSTIEVLNQPEVPGKDFHKWAREIPLRQPDHEIELGYHIARLRAHKYIKVAGSMQTDDYSNVLPFVDMPEYFSDEEEEAASESLKPPEPKASDHAKGLKSGRSLKEKTRKPLEMSESSNLSQNVLKQTDLQKLKQKKPPAKETRLPSVPEVLDARKGKKLTPPKESQANSTTSATSERKDSLKSLGAPKAGGKQSEVKHDDAGLVSHGSSRQASQDAIHGSKPSLPEFGTQTPAAWHVVSEDKIVESDLQVPGRRMRRRISGHNSGSTGASALGASAFRVRDFDGMREEDYEIKWIRKAILNHLTVLRQVYDKYTNLGSTSPSHFKPLMPRLALWLLYRDCGFHNRGLSMNEIDNMLAARPDSGVCMPHCPMERVYFWQFLHSLLDVSWVLYARHGLHGQLDRGTLAGALDKLIVDDVVPNTMEAQHESVFLEHVNLVPLDDAHALYGTQPHPYTARCFLANVFPKPGTMQLPEIRCFPVEVMTGQNVFTLGEVPVFIPGDTPLLGGEICHLTARLASLSGIGPKEVVKIMAKECPAIMEDGIIVNMNYPLSFVEWYEIVIMCAKACLVKEQMLYQKRLAEEEERRKAIEALEEERLMKQSLASVQSVTRNKKSTSRAAGIASKNSQAHSIIKQRPSNRNV